MSFTHLRALLLLGFILLIHTVNGRFPHCRLYWEMERARAECETQLQQQKTLNKTGCEGEWNNVSCWLNVAVGEVMTLPCPSPFLLLFGKNGNLSRKCTEEGWSSIYPDIGAACSSDISDKPSELHFWKVLQFLTYLSDSLLYVFLLTTCTTIPTWRKLHCMRNYIHLNLFVSFMLRAGAVLTKDTLLFSEAETTDCSTQPSLVGCKTSLVFFNYFIMANFFWLLVEGLYLHTLLLVIYTNSTRLSIYMFIGWGIPFVFMVAWIISRINLEDTRRLAKSTLLLIPLFGVNYVVFFYLMEPAEKTLKQVKIFFDLGLGSFQGLIVAVLYCFLNSEVQSELRRTWRSLTLKRCDCRLHTMSVNPNGAKTSTQFHRNVRAQSILQTETSML
ncbi:vasoactive intestinal polypeptide receptor 2-like [Nematolebias whitei]|uniref:vasoactive intestinal polypeptide receptor 2-like n=1 Tax=Nematolebias whitei TaxID=451745 RepID=UPI001899BB12|nr:vasoactive intestinal polypeptide receptor 2-like [Nematolebias whitei]